MPTGLSRFSWWQVPCLSEAVCHLTRGVRGGGGQGKCPPPNPVGGGGSPSLFSSLAFSLSPILSSAKEAGIFRVLSYLEKKVL